MVYHILMHRSSLPKLMNPQNLHQTLPWLQIYSDEFLINQILDNRQHEKSIGKDFQLPSALKSSFPSKHVINDLRLGFENKKPFKNDALRKTIIILFFYKYWCKQELNISLIKENFRYSTFIAEMDNYLNACGFEPLYIGNCKWKHNKKEYTLMTLLLKHIIVFSFIFSYTYPNYYCQCYYSASDNYYCP